MEGGHKLLHPMGDTILSGNSRLHDMVVPKLGCVGHDKRFGEFRDHKLAVVVFDGDANAPTGFTAEIP